VNADPTRLRTLIDRCRDMVNMLQQAETVDHPELLVESAHKLAGSAGMFGLVEASESARALEHAALAVSITALQDELDSTMAA
jgi:HPt (histidine-containing phosphotransfer) domain-containing protein